MQASAPRTYPRFERYAPVGSKTQFASLISLFATSYFLEVIVCANINTVTLVVEIRSFVNLREFRYCGRLFAKFVVITIALDLLDKTNTTIIRDLVGLDPGYVR